MIAWTRVKIAVFAPIPSEIVSTTVMAKPGDFANCRRANFRLDMILWTGGEMKWKQGTKSIPHKRLTNVRNEYAAWTGFGALVSRY
jgi:hypothetical protein